MALDVFETIINTTMKEHSIACNDYIRTGCKDPKQKEKVELLAEKLKFAQNAYYEISAGYANIYFVRPAEKAFGPYTSRLSYDIRAEVIRYVEHLIDFDTATSKDDFKLEYLKLAEYESTDDISVVYDEEHQQYCVACKSATEPCELFKDNKERLWRIPCRQLREYCPADFIHFAASKASFSQVSQYIYDKEARMAEAQTEVNKKNLNFN